MTIPDFETVIPCAPIDLNKLKFVVLAVLGYTDTSHVHIITPDASLVDRFENVLGEYVSIHEDRDVLDIDQHALFKHRPNWVYQQFIKLFQNVTSTDWFLVIDADLMFNRYIALFEDGQPQFLFGLDQNYEPYFRFNQHMIGIGKTYPYSFLSECTLYNKQLIEQMLSDNGYQSHMQFIEKAATVIDADCHPAESELYGSYIYATRPDLYGYKYLKAHLGGKYGSKQWTDEEIVEKIQDLRYADIDIFTIHSWEGAVEE